MNIGAIFKGKLIFIAFEIIAFPKCIQTAKLSPQPQVLEALGLLK